MVLLCDVVWLYAASSLQWFPTSYRVDTCDLHWLFVFLSFLSLNHRYLINVPNRFVLVSTELSPGNTDSSWSQICSIWAFFVVLKDRVETWPMQFCRAHRTPSIMVWTDPVDQFMWWRISWSSMRDILKIVSAVPIRPWISLSCARLERSSICQSMQNGIDYNLMLEYGWKSLADPDIWSKILKNGRNRKRRSACVFWSFRSYVEMR